MNDLWYKWNYSQLNYLYAFDFLNYSIYWNNTTIDRVHHHHHHPGVLGHACKKVLVVHGLESVSLQQAKGGIWSMAMQRIHTVFTDRMVKQEAIKVASLIVILKEWKEESLHLLLYRKIDTEDFKKVVGCLPRCTSR